MKKIALVYFSGTGHTHLMAEAVAAGARAVEGVEVTLHRITGEQIKDGRWQDEATVKALQEAQTIVFGAPTYMGGPAAQFKAFADATGMVWFQQGWRNKLAGGFTHSGSPSGDKLSTLQYLADLAFHLGRTVASYSASLQDRQDHSCGRAGPSWRENGNTHHGRRSVHFSSIVV